MNRQTDELDLQMFAALRSHAPDERRAESVRARCRTLLSAQAGRRPRRSGQWRVVGRLLEIAAVGALSVAYLAAAGKDVWFLCSHLWE